MNDKVILGDIESIFERNIDWTIFDNKTILITGAYGMLASYVTHLFMYLHDVKDIKLKLILVIKSREKLRLKFGELDKNYIQEYTDSICDPIKIEGPVDYIIHAASLASPQYYATIPVDVLEPNAIGTYNLLNIAVQKKVKGFLMFSTGDVYGRVHHTDVIGEDDFGSMDTLNIHNCYSESKRMAETMCKAFCVQYGVPVRIARIWHTYAPTMDIQNDPRVFSSFVKNVIEGKNICIHSDGSGKRSFCYVTDAVAGMLKILIDGADGEAYNVCNETQCYSILELGEIISGLRPEKKLSVCFKKRDKKDSYTENIHLAGNDKYPSSDKLQKLGWHANIDVREGFNRVLKYLEDNYVGL